MYYIRCNDGMLDETWDDINDAISDVNALNEFSEDCGPHVLVNDENEVVYSPATIK